MKSLPGTLWIFLTISLDTSRDQESELLYIGCGQKVEGACRLITEMGIDKCGDFPSLFSIFLSSHVS